MSNTRFRGEEKRKVTFRIGEDETEVDFVLMKKEHPWITRNVKAIPGEFQHALVATDVDKKKIRKVIRKTCTERRMISLLKDFRIRNQFDKQVFKLDDVRVPYLWGHFKNGILKACDEVCWKKRRSKGYTLWWNEEVKETVSRKK